MSDEQTPPPIEASRAIVPLSADGKHVQAIIPRNTEEASRMANAIISSGIVPAAFKFKSNEWEGDGDNSKQVQWKDSPNKALIVMGILKSMEVGMAPITGLSFLLPINDRFTIWGDGAVALAQGRGLVAKQTRANVGPAIEPGLPMGDWPDEYGVEVRFWRVGQTEPYVGRFTVGDARRANLWMNTNKKPWIMYPDRMLFNRARAFALRDGFADALSGLGIAEEVRDMTPDPIDAGELRSAKRAALFSDDETPQEAIEEGEVEEVPAEPAEAAGEAQGQPGGLL